MNDPKHESEPQQRGAINRRAFLATSASLSALQIVQPHRSASGAPASRTPEIIDTHLYLGRWPFGRTEANSPQKTTASLRTHHIAQAWAGTFDGLLHKDVSGANARLAEACRREGAGVLIPFGTINPTLPDWQEDVRRCHERFKMPGIRLHPTYHGYTLDDPRFSELAALADKRKLIVQIVAALDDRPRPYLRLPTKPLDLESLAGMARQFSELEVTLHERPKQLDARQLEKLAALPNIYFESAAIADAHLLPAEKVVLGSCWPSRLMTSAEIQSSPTAGHETARRLLRNAANAAAAE